MGKERKQKTAYCQDSSNLSLVTPFAGWTKITDVAGCRKMSKGSSESLIESSSNGWVKSVIPDSIETTSPSVGGGSEGTSKFTFWSIKEPRCLLVSFLEEGKELYSY